MEDCINTKLEIDFSTGNYKSLLSVKFNINKINIVKTYVMYKTNKSIIFSTITDYKKHFVLKKSLNKHNEYIISSYICNYLRKDIPNFVYCFGIHGDCLVYEFINGITLNNYIKFCSLGNFLNIFRQVLFSLDYAWKRYKFTHYDLQTSNIIVKNIENNIVINYDDKKVFTNNIAVIIDYDTSFGIVNGKKSSRQRISCPFFDLYMFINSCLTDSYGVINDYLNKVAEFFKIIDNALDLQYRNINYNFDIPLYTEKLSDINYDTFFDFLYFNKLI